MMSLHVIETGEVVETMTAVEAERITSRIADKLDAIADAHEQVLPLIGEAMTRQAWKALNYQSPQSYVSERFGRALERLNVPVRRAVVAELSEAGMSTRETGSIVGTSHKTVVKDRQRVVPPVPVATASTTPSASSPAEPETTAHGLPKSEHIIDRRGYKHSRPEPQAAQRPPRPSRRPITDVLHGISVNIDRELTRFFDSADDRASTVTDDVETMTRNWRNIIRQIEDAYSVTKNETPAETGEGSQ